MKLLLLIFPMVLLPTYSSNGQPKDEFDLEQTIAEADFTQEFVNFLKEHLMGEDVVTVETAMSRDATVQPYKGLAPFWLVPTEKEICKGKTGLRFAKRVKETIDERQRVTVWKDENGNYHAEMKYNATLLA